ncbi:hypothetical protein [Oceanobacillus manasiensis]|uniref:hypothetical protein n=1 Tax=Oceanobacillus manasiensis TaxID=586413 RepID=UPI0005A63D63|nr:hypothetical protein [Oceanobacillus manasiensis]
MSEWKQAYQTAALELRASKLNIVFGFVITILVSFFLITTLSSYLDNGYVGYDFIYLILFSIGGLWCKPKEFQIQVNADLLASPILIMQLALPVKRSVLVKSRFIIQFFYSAPLQLYFLIAFYLFSPIGDTLGLANYLAFSLLWLLIGLVLGSYFVTGDAGDSSKLSRTTIGSIFVGILMLIVAFTVLTSVHFLTGEGPVYWSIEAAEKWPLVSLCITLLLTLVATRYLHSYMQKRITKLDYL